MFLFLIVNGKFLCQDNHCLIGNLKWRNNFIIRWFIWSWKQALGILYISAPLLTSFVMYQSQGISDSPLASFKCILYCSLLRVLKSNFNMMDKSNNKIFDNVILQKVYQNPKMSSEKNNPGWFGHKTSESIGFHKDVVINQRILV